MQVNYFIIGVVGFLAIALIIFLIRRNLKDEREFMEELNGTPQNGQNVAEDTENL